MANALHARLSILFPIENHYADRFGGGAEQNAQIFFAINLHTKFVWKRKFM